MQDAYTNRCAVVKLILGVIITLAAFIYSMPILGVPRHHHRNNIFTFNVCITIILCSLMYGLAFIIPFLDHAYVKDPSPGTSIEQAQVLLGFASVISFLLVPFHRCSLIVFHRIRFFHRKRWTRICLWSGWALACLLYIPFLMQSPLVRLVVVVLLLSPDTGCLLESDATLGTVLHVRQYVRDAVGDLSGLERADLLTRSYIVPSSTSSVCPLQQPRRSR